MLFRVLQSHALRLPAISARLKGAVLGNRSWLSLHLFFFYIDISWEGGHNDVTQPPFASVAPNRSVSVIACAGRNVPRPWHEQDARQLGERRRK